MILNDDDDGSLPDLVPESNTSTSSTFSSPHYRNDNDYVINENNNNEGVDQDEFFSDSSSSLPASSWIDAGNNDGHYIVGRNFLAILDVDFDDFGLVACVANNSNTIVRHDMLLFVKGRIVLI